MTQDGLHWKAMIRQLPDCICVWDYLWRDDARQGQKGRENISLSIMWSHVTAVHARAIPKTLMWIRDECRSYNRHSLWLGLSFWNTLLLEIWRFFWLPCWLGWICQNHLPYLSTSRMQSNCVHFSVGHTWERCLHVQLCAGWRQINVAQQGL